MAVTDVARIALVLIGKMQNDRMDHITHGNMTESDAEIKKVKKQRNRSTLVCTNCKRRKTKCDKKQPCTRCINSGKASTCTYNVIQPINSSNTFNDPASNQFILYPTNEEYLPWQLDSSQALKSSGLPDPFSPLRSISLSNKLTASPQSHLPKYSEGFPLNYKHNEQTSYQSSQISYDYKSNFQPSSKITCQSSVLNNTQPNYPANIPANYPIGYPTTYITNQHSVPFQPKYQSDYQSGFPINYQSSYQAEPETLENQVISIPSCHPNHSRQSLNQTELLGKEHDGLPVMDKDLIQHPGNNTSAAKSGLEDDRIKRLSEKINQLAVDPSKTNRILMLQLLEQLKLTLQTKSTVPVSRLSENSNVILDANVWKLSKDTGIIRNRVTTLNYASTLWNSRDFVYLATELFDPLLELYFKRWEKVKCRKVLIDLNLTDRSKIDGIITKIKPFMIHNLKAIQERVEYFKTNLNFFIFGKLIPVQLLESIINFDLIYGHLKYSEKYKECYFEIALIFAIINISETFDKLNNTSKYEFQLDNTFENLTDVCISLINMTNYKQRTNYVGLITFLMISYTSLIYNKNAYTGLNREYIYPLLREHIGMLFQLGYHLNHDPNDSENVVEKYRNFSIKKKDLWFLWNFYLQLDGEYSVRLGTPLLINDEFCEKFHLVDPTDPLEMKSMNYVSLVRDLAHLLNSKSGTNYGSILTFMDRVMESYDTLECFKTRETLRYHDNDCDDNHSNGQSTNGKLYYTVEDRFNLDIKIKYIKLIFFLNLLLFCCFKKENIKRNFPEMGFDSPHYIEIVEIRKLCGMRILLLICLTYRLIEFLSNDNNATKEILLCLRGELIPCFGFPTLCTLDCVLTLYGDASNDERPNQIDINDIPLNELDVILRDEQLIKKYNKEIGIGYLDFPKNTQFIIRIYEAARSNPILSDNFEFYIKSKIIGLAVYVLTMFSELKKHHDVKELGLYSVLSRIVTQRLYELQHSKSCKRDALLSVILNDEEVEEVPYGLNPNIATLMEQTDPQRLQPGNIQLQHQTWNGKIDLGGNNRAIQLHSLKTDNSQDLLPPDQLVSMIHLFINDERFTSGITSFDIDFSRMKMP